MRDGMAPVYSVAETMLFSSSRMLICLLRSVMVSLLTQVGCPDRAHFMYLVCLGGLDHLTVILPDADAATPGDFPHTFLCLPPFPPVCLGDGVCIIAHMFAFVKGLCEILFGYGGAGRGTSSDLAYARPPSPEGKAILLPTNLAFPLGEGVAELAR